MTPDQSYKAYYVSISLYDMKQYAMVIYYQGKIF